MYLLQFKIILGNKQKLVTKFRREGGQIGLRKLKNLEKLHIFLCYNYFCII